MLRTTRNLVLILLPTKILKKQIKTTKKLLVLLSTNTKIPLNDENLILISLSTKTLKIGPKTQRYKEKCDLHEYS